MKSRNRNFGLLDFGESGLDSINLKALRPANAAQRFMQEAIRNKDNQFVFAVGPAGSGKSLCAIHQGIEFMQDPNNPINRLVFIRANVFVDDENDVGFLPGELFDKYAPHFAPIMDNLRELGIGREYVTYLLETDQLELLPILYCRGRSFNNTYVIFEEAQNASRSQMLTVLTRLGRNSKCVITGDPTQIDRTFKDGGGSGLTHAVQRLDNCSGVYVQYFTKGDIVRGKNLSKIIDRLS